MKLEYFVCEKHDTFTYDATFVMSYTEGGVTGSHHHRKIRHGLAITGSCDQLSVSANTSSETNRCKKEEDVIIKKHHSGSGMIY